MRNEFSAAEVAQFERDGFQVVRGLVPPAACARMLEVAERDLALTKAPLEYEAETQYPGAPASLESPCGDCCRLTPAMRSTRSGRRPHQWLHAYANCWGLTSRWRRPITTA